MGRFDGVYRKITRAKHHTDDLKRRYLTYLQTEPYTGRTDGDRDTGPLRVILDEIKTPLPDEIVDCLADAIHNLRAAFDHYAYAITNGNNDAAFPSWRQTRQPRPSEWDAQVKGKLAGGPIQILEAVEALQVYPAGHENWLWVLGHLDNLDKHRLLVVVDAVGKPVTASVLDALRGVVTFSTPGGEPWDPLVKFGLLPEIWKPLEPGDVLVTYPNGLQPNTNPQLLFQIALGEPDIAKGYNAQTFLKLAIQSSEQLLGRLIALDP